MAASSCALDGDPPGLTAHMWLAGAEAQAALAAVQWVSGQQSKAEEHFEKAVALDSRWSSMAYIRQQTRWPPALYDAMEKFLAISMPA